MNLPLEHQNVLQHESATKLNVLQCDYGEEGQRADAVHTPTFSKLQYESVTKIHVLQHQSATKFNVLQCEYGNEGQRADAVHTPTFSKLPPVLFINLKVCLFMYILACRYVHLCILVCRYSDFMLLYLFDLRQTLQAVSVLYHILKMHHVFSHKSN
jgi:hypothetical protein